MRLGFAKITSCPHCGGEKEIMSLMSGNYIGAELWSDGKLIAPMLQKPSPVQKCPHCRKYYFMPPYEETKKSESLFGARGLLSYLEWKEAYWQFCESFESPENISKVNSIKLNNVRFWVLQAYNDFYYRGNDEHVPSAEEFEFVKSIAIRFVEEYGDVEPLMKAEIYREINEMQKCSAILSSICTEHLNDSQMGIYCEIKERMEKGDNRVFRIKHGK